MSASNALLEINDATVMQGGNRVLDRFTLRIAEGQHTAVLGANGSGKSSLVKLVARQLYPLARADGAASVRVFGRERWNVAQLQGLLGIVSPALQQTFAADERLEVFDAVLSGFFASRGTGQHHAVTQAMREAAGQTMAQLDAMQLIGRRLATLSTGEARRVLIARALVHRPRALLLDEPCTGLDLVARRRFLEHLRILAQAGVTLLLVTHHVEEIIPEMARVALLRGGRVLAHGNKAALLDNAHLTEAFGMPMAVSRQGDWFSAALA